MKHILNSIHHLFIPHEGNNFRSKLLHHDLLTVYLVFSLLITFGVSHIQSSSGSILGYATDISTTKLFDLTNREREEAGLSQLTYSAKLAQAAQSKAAHMFANQYWSHYGPLGETPWQFIMNSGYQYEFAGENLAKNFLSSDGVVNAWMDSPTHRENILRKEYADVGFAIVNGVLNGEETTLVVQMFGTPLYGLAPEQAENPASAEKVAQVAEDPLAIESITKPSSSETLGAPGKAQPAFYSLFLNLNILFFTLLLAALVLDLYFATKLNLIHIKGKNLIHILFLCSVMAGSYFVISGSIL